MADSASTSLIDLVTHDWKQINLPALRGELDEKLLGFDKLAKDNKQHRKELSKQTKELKKCDRDGKLKKLGSVLKAYQKHIDLKARESKSVFEAFLRVYKVLSEAPDPIDALQNGQIQILKLQSSLLDHNDLKMKLRNYEKEFTDLKNQEITVKTLREQVKQQKSEQLQLVEDKLAELQKSLSVRFNQEMELKDAKCSELKEQCKNLQQEVSSKKLATSTLAPCYLDIHIHDPPPQRRSSCSRSWTNSKMHCFRSTWRTTSTRTWRILRAAVWRRSWTAPTLPF